MMVHGLLRSPVVTASDTALGIALVLLVPAALGLLSWSILDGRRRATWIHILCDPVASSVWEGGDARVTFGLRPLSHTGVRQRGEEILVGFTDDEISDSHERRDQQNAGAAAAAPSRSRGPRGHSRGS
jgi:hypothetical protein